MEFIKTIGIFLMSNADLNRLSEIFTEPAQPVRDANSDLTLGRAGSLSAQRIVDPQALNDPRGLHTNPGPSYGGGQEASVNDARPDPHIHRRRESGAIIIGQLHESPAVNERRREEREVLDDLGDLMEFETELARFDDQERDA
jgi:hypothetical protein